MKKIDLIKYGLQGFLCGLVIGGAFAFTLAIGQYNGKTWFDSVCFWNMGLLFCPIFAGLITWEIIKESDLEK